MSLQTKDKAGRFVTAYQDDIITKFRDIHGDRYDYSKVIYKRSHDKVSIICRVHGEFHISSNNHITGQGCLPCGIEQGAKKRDYVKLGQQLSLDRRHTKEQFIDKATQIHGDRYDYSLVEYVNNHKKVNIICSKHGMFEQAPSKHINIRRGCSKCGNQVSKISNKWLDDLGITVREYRLPERKLRVVDGYDPFTNTIYQFHGDFYHGNPEKFSPDDINPLTKITYGEAYALTIQRDAELINLGYNLITIWEADYVRQVGKRKAYDGAK